MFSKHATFLKCQAAKRASFMFFQKRPNSEKLLSFSPRTATQEQLHQTTTHIAGWSQVVARLCLPFLEPLQAQRTDQKKKKQPGFNKSWKVSKEKQGWDAQIKLLAFKTLSSQNLHLILTPRFMIASQVHVMGFFFSRSVLIIFFMTFLFCFISSCTQLLFHYNFPIKAVQGKE